jgi:transposase
MWVKYNGLLLNCSKNGKPTTWLGGKRKIQLHFTPTYASWLNQIEICNILSKDVVKDGI